jgi:magnesium transporter
VADHVQLEFLLESFTKQVEEVITQTESISSDIQATLEVAELMLDSVRNSLMDLDIKIGVSTLSVGTGALIAGVFGMNVSHLLTHCVSRR